MIQDELFKVLVAHCKEYGFIFPSSEIYDGLAAVYDYGQMGVELKNNINADLWIQPCGHPLGQEQGASAASTDTGGRSVFVG